MEQMLKQNGESENPQRTAQAKFTSKSRESGLAKGLDSSPMMVAQRQKLQNLFGGAAQLKGTEEEPLQAKHSLGEEEFLPGKFGVQQRKGAEEEPLQGKPAPAQRAGSAEKEEPLQGKFTAESPAQRESQPSAKLNHTGLPDNLKSGIESLSGMSMDNVRVHYNSSQPAQLNALAYAQGTDIHVAPGQEQHLPHEAWHVVQQAQGRVKPTMQMKDGVPVNDDRGLEREADVMGGEAVAIQRKSVCAGLANVDYKGLNDAGQAAYKLLDNQRAGFASIDKTGGGVNAQVDGEGRVVSAEREISNKSAPRDPKLQAVIGWLGRLEEGKTTGYDGGHLIASSLGGPGSWGNMVPQDYIENRWGDWRQYERQVTKAKSNTGSPQMFLKVQLGYSGDSVLPDKWDSSLVDKNDGVLDSHP